MSEPTLDTEAFRQFERIAHDRIADSYQTFFEPVTQHAIAPLLDTAAMQQRIRTVFDRLVCAYASGGGIALPMGLQDCCGV